MKRLIAIFALLMSHIAAFGQSEAGGVIKGAERLEEFHHLLEGRRVGVVMDNASEGNSHLLVDALLASGVDMQLIFTPASDTNEGKARRSRDAYTGIEVISMRRAPRANDVFRCDVILYDVEDTGLSTSSSLLALYRMMSVCAAIGVPLVVLDRPNPNGAVVDGAILEEGCRTSAEQLPLPLLHGMTMGEMARMINGEGWLPEGSKCPLTVVPCLYYLRSQSALGASPQTLRLPSLCYFEALGVATPSMSELCGSDDPQTPPAGIDLAPLLEAYNKWKSSEENPTQEFFTSPALFDRLAGASYVRDMILFGYNAHEIEGMWHADVERFTAQREQYLIYDE